jgi:hypothetical protein
MGRQRHGAEQIIAKLREAEVELARGKTAGEICRQLGITEQTTMASTRAPNASRPRSPACSTPCCATTPCGGTTRSRRRPRR